MRKKFLIKPALQLRHLAWTLLVVLVCFASCYFLFEHLVTVAVSQNAMDFQQWLQLRTATRIGFGVALVVLLGAIGIENYLFFHTIAGPIYALEKGLRRLAEGDFTNVIRIRETDQLRDLIAAFEDMKTKLAARIESQEAAVRTFTAEIDRALADASNRNVESLMKKLKEIRDQADRMAA
jgi:methyl-accepting chemotaxis protein